VTSKLPHAARFLVSQVLAVTVYFPLARLSLLLEKLGLDISRLPLSQYRHNSLYVMRNDSLDRFGTRLEQRFSKKDIAAMMERCGLERVRFSETSFWTAVGFKR
jgi:hypothetical protein